MRVLMAILVFSFLLVMNCDCQAKIVETREIKLTIMAKGSPRERMRDLWRQSRPIIEKDAKAAYSDPEYLSRRKPLFETWVNLQFKLAWEGKKNPSPSYEKAERIIPDVLGSIDNLYGFPGFSKPMREKRRISAKKSIDAKLKRIDQWINELP